MTFLPRKFTQAFILALTLCGCQDRMVAFPGKIVFATPTDQGLGLVSARGTWKALDFEYAHPANLVNIKCIRDTRFCIVSEVTYDIPPRIFADIDLYELKSWESHQVVADWGNQRLKIDLEEENVWLYTAHGTMMLVSARLMDAKTGKILRPR